MDFLLKELMAIPATALRTIGIGDLSNSQTPSQDEAGARQEASDAKKGKYLLPSQSTPARNPRGFFQESYEQQTSEVLENQGDNIARTQSSAGAGPAVTDRSGRTSSTNNTTSRGTSSYTGAPSPSTSLYANSRIKNMNREYEKSVTDSKLYADLSLNVPPTKNVIEKYRKSLVVPSGEVEKERALAEWSEFVVKKNSQLEKEAKKQGLEFPDRVYEGPRR